MNIIEALSIAWAALFVFTMGFLGAHMEPRKENAKILKVLGAMVALIGIFLAGSLF